VTTRVQVILDEDEKEVFQHRARTEGLSLSAWLRKAGQEMIEKRTEKITSQEDLDAFFAACDARERGVEPDWEEHLAVIERSRRSGMTET
jgi:hypothetical protein